jgi:hypothetical protein
LQVSIPASFSVDQTPTILLFFFSSPAQHGRWAFKMGKFYSSSLHLAAAFFSSSGAGLVFNLIFVFPPPTIISFRRAACFTTPHYHPEPILIQPYHQAK